MSRLMAAASHKAEEIKDVLEETPVLQGGFKSAWCMVGVQLLM